MPQQSSRDLIDELRWQIQEIKNKQAEQVELFGKVEAAREKLQALTARASSPDGSVTVVAGSGGIVQSVQLADDATRTNAATLAAAINTTIQQAIADATRQQLEIVREAGGGAVTAEQILGPQAKLAEYGQRPAATTSPSPPARQDRFGHDEDGFHSVFE